MREGETVNVRILCAAREPLKARCFVRKLRGIMALHWHVTIALPEAAHQKLHGM